MSRYLSPEWLTDLDTAVRSVHVGDGTSIAIEQRVTGAAGGGEAVVYRLVAVDGRAGVATGPFEQTADVVLTLDVATAVDVARGRLNALEALQAGRIRLAGDADALRAASALLVAVAGATADLRAATEYPDAPEG